LIAAQNKYGVALYEYSIPIFDNTRAKYGVKVQKQLDLISQAMELGNLESMWYFGASAPRKAISRIQPALQFPSCFLTAMNGFPMVGANLEPHVWNEIFDKDVGGA
jgi:hypothetical protein